MHYPYENIKLSFFTVVQQSLFPEPLSMQNNLVQALKALWEKTQLKGTHSFETAMVQSTFPHQKVNIVSLLGKHPPDIKH